MPKLFIVFIPSRCCMIEEYKSCVVVVISSPLDWDLDTILRSNRRIPTPTMKIMPVRIPASLSAKIMYTIKIIMLAKNDKN